MVSANVDRVLEETKRWSLDERRQLLALLGAAEVQRPLTDAEMDRLLVGKGVLSAPPPPGKPTADEVARAQAWQPVPIQGPPLSETIIEERR